MKFYNEDKLVNKQGSILRLKSELVQNDKYLNDCSFTKKELLLLCKDFKIKISAQKRKDEIAGLISKTILSSDIAYIPEESNTLDAEEPGPSGTATRPLCSVSVPSGQPEKELKKAIKRKRKRKRGKKERLQKILMINVQCAIDQLWKGNFGYVVIIVPYGIIEIVYIYKMNRSG